MRKEEHQKAGCDHEAGQRYRLEVVRSKYYMVLNDTLDLSQLSEIARSGLRSPRMVRLNAGEVLFRFASASSPAHQDSNRNLLKQA